MADYVVGYRLALGYNGRLKFRPRTAEEVCDEQSRVPDRKYLSGKVKIPVPAKRNPPQKDKCCGSKGACG